MADRAFDNGVSDAQPERSAPFFLNTVPIQAESKGEAMSSMKT